MGYPRIRQQAGYALILVVLGMMGLGGIVLTDFTRGARQDLENRRVAHNREVLRQAKQALLMYAYDYPMDNPGRGPGRLPCPDTDDDDGFANSTFNCVSGGNAVVGRLPWNDPDLGIPELLDASGERLWYAVSQNFANSISPAAADVVNSDSFGTITLIDQGGRLVYDGADTTAGAGIAAVIFAPGPITRRDNDGNGTYEYVQQRGTPIQRVDPRNYLDTFTDAAGAFDNSLFNNGESDTDEDGFILGPVLDGDVGDVVVNDQMIIITAEEVIAMAEKAVLETYRDAIETYQQTLWATPANRRYPWLAAYEDTIDLDAYDARPGRTSGRVPFMDYFVDENSPNAVVVGDLQISFDLHLAYISMVDNLDPFDPTYIAAASAVVTDYPESDQTINISNALVSFSRTSFNGASDLSTDSLGTLIVRDYNGTSAITATTYPTNTERRYFWDGCPTCFEAADGWEMCPVNVGDGTDCARNAAGTAYVAFTAWEDHADVRIRMIEFQYIDPEFVIELDYLPAPVVTAPTQPTGTLHSRQRYTFRSQEVTVLPIVDPAEPDSRNFFDIKVSMCDQDDFVGDELNLYSLNNENASTILCTVDLDLDITPSYHDDLVIWVDWFPPLPTWVGDNDWDDAVMLSYMPDFAPGGDGGCTDDADPATPVADDCLVVSNLGGVNNNVRALLVIAGEHDFIDGDDLNNDGDFLDADEDPPDLDFSNDLQDIFEPENYSGLWPHPVPNNDPDAGSDSGLPRIFDKREDSVPGNFPDTVFVIN